MNIRLWLATGAALLLSFSGKAAPFITSFSPTYGAYNDLDYVHIYGSGFYPGTPVIVRFNGVNATTVYVYSPTEIRTLVPTNAPLGLGPIYVSVAGLSTYSADNFRVIGLGPYVDHFSPIRGAAATQVEISGAHLAITAQPWPTVRFNGVLTTNFASNPGPTNLQVYAPNGVTTGPISVTTSAGTSISDGLFYVTPVISSFSPFLGRAGTNVTIRGVNFTNALSVKFNGTDASFTVINNTNISAVVPVGAATGPIRIDTPAGNPAITSSNFLIQPTLFSFTPDAGPPGTSVAVTGAGFSTSGITVRFGGVTAPTPSNLTAISFSVGVPVAATNAPITVTNNNGTGAYTSARLFYVPAAITNLSSTNATSGSIQINGWNFIGTSAVACHGAAPLTYTNATNNLTMSVPVPAGVITGPLSVTTPAGTVGSGSLVFCGVPVINNVSPGSGQVNTLVTLTGTNFLYASSVSFNGTNATIWGVTNNGMIAARVPAGATTGPITVTGPAGSAVSGAFTVNYYSDLAVSMTNVPNPVFVGSNLTYTITITNKGPDAALNVRLTNSHPSIITNLGALNSGNKTVVTVKTTPSLAGTIVNTASMSSDSTDLVPADNSASVSTVVWPIPVLGIAPQAANLFRLTWPAPLSNFTLQFTTNVALTNAWTSVTNRPAIVNTQSVLFRTNAGSNGFYRLKN